MLRHIFILIALAVPAVSVAQTESANQDLQATTERTDEDSAMKSRITDVRLAFDEQDVLLSFKLLGVFDDNFRRRLESGLPTSLKYEFELRRSRKSWFDKATQTGNLQVDAMYNAVTREYLINFKHDDQLIESRVVKDPAELLSSMTEFADFPVFSAEGKNPQQRFRVRVRSELRTRTIFFFIPSTVHTDWAETRKFRFAEEID
ncbi:MAG: DUF4390 domain-containing protein [Acidobacteriota bacterium]